MRPALIAVLIVRSAAAFASDASLVYVPIVQVSAPRLPGSTGTNWASSLEAANLSEEPQELQIVDLIGGGLYPLCPLPISDEIPPHSSRVFRSEYPRTPLCMSAGVGLLVLRVPSRVDVSAAIYLIAAGDEISKTDFDRPAQSLLGARLPVYRELFPPGSTAVAGNLAFQRCNDSPDCQHSNLTIVNAGSQPANVTVTLVGTGGHDLEVRVPAHDLLQINRLPLSDADWVAVSADQPFLCYASSIFEDPLTNPGLRVDMAAFRILQ